MLPLVLGAEKQRSTEERSAGCTEKVLCVFQNGGKKRRVERSYQLRKEKKKVSRLEKGKEVESCVE